MLPVFRADDARAPEACGQGANVAQVPDQHPAVIDTGHDPNVRGRYTMLSNGNSDMLPAENRLPIFDLVNDNVINAVG